MKIVLLIRRDKEYWLHSKMSFNNAIGKGFEKTIRDNAIVWNFCFKMRYLEFRKRLSYISSFSYSPNKFDDIIPYLDQDRINNLELGTLLVPMDDDDWFSPSLVKNLRKIKEPCEGIYWDQYTKHLDGKINYENRHIGLGLPHIIDSCCYGLKTPCDYEEVKMHWLPRKQHKLHLSKRLSMKIESLACISVQHWLDIGRAMTLANYKKFAMDLLEKEIGSSIIFPEEYKHQAELYKELLEDLLKSII